ncbi:hypothetical protein [Halodesulfovibrio marinisediminis]|uniref:Uncharacterized protein n=1 Tax=Halodesulfovibrio marinisediminis DSM 17456 TaxID=1121457 RepID=A0A1N6DNE0_9BACT|nr:hypothetical protein [Halodesulfovibrio marinisediminis]SIN72183.1 hypothetical protein SAMN02745161_0332 [Halodesulfovibrio marinisediminis DSM 17456]
MKHILLLLIALTIPNIATADQIIILEDDAPDVMVYDDISEEEIIIDSVIDYIDPNVVIIDDRQEPNIVIIDESPEPDVIIIDDRHEPDVVIINDTSEQDIIIINE